MFPHPAPNQLTKRTKIKGFSSYKVTLESKVISTVDE